MRTVNMTNPLTWLSRWRQCHQLLRMDDQILADIGRSRALLRGGVRAWPWAAPEDSMARLGRFRFSASTKNDAAAASECAASSATVAPGDPSCDPAIRRAASSSQKPLPSIAATDRAGSVRFVALAPC